MLYSTTKLDSHPDIQGLDLYSIAWAQFFGLNFTKICQLTYGSEKPFTVSLTVLYKVNYLSLTGACNFVQDMYVHCTKKTINKSVNRKKIFLYHTGIFSMQGFIWYVTFVATKGHSQVQKHGCRTKQQTFIEINDKKTPTKLGSSSVDVTVWTGPAGLFGLQELVRLRP